MYEIHSHPLLQRYKAHVCSTASIFNIFIIGLTYIPPLLIAYFSQGFWLKESTYREQPEVSFKHQLIVIVQGSAVNSLVAYSTYQNFNNLLGDKLRIPLIQSHEVDTNQDGKKDFLNFEIQVPMKDSENVNSVQLLFFFDYKLHRFSTLQMESLAYIHYNSPIAGATFETEGELKLKQKYSLPHKGIYSTYNVPIVDSSSVFLDAYDLSTIFSKYQSRNISTDYISRYPIWKGGRSSSTPFIVKGKIHYPEETVMYRPGFWQLIKVAWVQYLAVLFVFLFVFGKIRRIVIENYVVLTVAQKVTIQKHQS